MDTNDIQNLKALLEKADPNWEMAHEHGVPIAVVKLPTPHGILRGLLYTGSEDSQPYHNIEAAVALRNLAPSLLDELETANGRVERLEKCVAFFSSVIKSGEPWTDACQRALEDTESEKGT